MVRAEDKQFEEEIMNGGHDIAVPFELSVTETGLDILAYSFCLDVAREFEERFSADPTSPEAREFLYSKLMPTIEELGFETDGDGCRVYYKYRCTSPRHDRILPECRLIDRLRGVKYHEDLPLDEFALDPSDETDRMAVIDDAGTVVCFCGINDMSDEEGFVEITVECAEPYRGRGYGASTVAMLTEHLLSCGLGVEYVCSDRNEPSKRTASAAGFELYKTALSFVCYRIEDDENELREDDINGL